MHSIHFKYLFLINQLLTDKDRSPNDCASARHLIHRTTILKAVDS